MSFCLGIARFQTNSILAFFPFAVEATTRFSIREPKPDHRNREEDFGTDPEVRGRVRNETDLRDPKPPGRGRRKADESFGNAAW